MIKKDRKNRSNDDKNWKILFEKQFENLQNKICKTWINGFSKLSFDTEKVPDLDYLNKQFQNLTD